MTGTDAMISYYRQGVMRAVERRLYTIKRKIAFRNWQRWDINTGIRMASFSVLVILFWSTTFIGVYRLCNALVVQPILGPVFLQRIFTFGFLSVFTLSFLSHILTAYSSLFIQSELLILHAAPIHPASLFRVQARDALIRGSWMIGLICLPILMAYGYSLNAYQAYYPLAVTGLIPFLLISGSLGIAVTVLVIPYFAGRPKRLQFLSMVLASLLVAGIWGGAPRLMRFLETPSAAEFSKHLADISTSQSAYTPYRWLWELMDAGVSWRVNDILLYSVLLWSTAWLCLVFTNWLGERVYVSGWLAVQDRSRHRRAASRRRRFLGNILTKPLPSWFGALIRRDVKLFLRDAGQWSQFIIVLCLVLIYLLHVYNVSMGPTSEQYKLYIVLFNVVLMGFVQATLALRYAFPSISLEGRAVWSILKSPLGIERYLIAKLMQQLSWILLFGEGMTMLLNYLLDITPPVSYLGLLIAGLFSFCFAACTVGLGAYFSRFDTGSIEISSGTGALITAIVTLSYLALSVAVLARLVLLNTSSNVPFVQHILDGEVYVILLVVFFVLLQITIVIYPLHLGAQKLRELS